VKPLHKKLFRDLLRLRGQVLTIAMVVMCGVASWISLRATYASLHEARSSYYEAQRFGEVFVDCEGAPDALAHRLAEIPGVSRVHVTSKEAIRIVMPGQKTPPIGVAIGVPAGTLPPVDHVLLRKGDWPSRGSRDEAVVLESFADAHGLTPGDRLTVVLYGAERRLRVVGTAISPEYLFAIPPGDTTGDPSRFAVVWVDREGLAALTDRAGVFNHASFALMPGASRSAVIAEVDRLLAPYGGVGARPREEQMSDRAITQELEQLRGMALWAPAIFLGVAAFLLHVVLGRLILLERPEIASLRAVGYTGLEVGTHYLSLVLGISLVGAAAGVAFGAWFGSLMTELSADFFHFPSPPFHIGVDVAAVGILVSVGAASVGALSSVRKVVSLPPAEAMQPPAPPTYRRGVLERLGVMGLLTPAARMGLRQILRQPGRVLISVVALSFAIAINVVGRFNLDVLDEFLSLQFTQAMREDVSVTFRRSIDERAIHELAALPGVDRAEPLRTTAVAISRGHVRRERVLEAHTPGAELRHVFDRFGKRVTVPEEGIILDDYTAGLLDVKVGDEVDIETLEGERKKSRVRVSAIFEGLTAMIEHADVGVVERISGSAYRVGGAALSVDAAQEEAVIARLSDMPEVMQVSRRTAAIERFEELTGKSMTVMTLVLTFFAAVIAVGVVYNDARVALSSQARELASLRVLGFELHEVGSMLSGQLALEVVLALAPGLLLGRALSELIMTTVDPEMYRFPVIIRPETYLFAASVVLVSALASTVLVRRRVRRLNLIEVLKTRD
jgi:putative ABC transport system permease protein